MSMREPGAFILAAALLMLCAAASAWAQLPPDPTGRSPAWSTAGEETPRLGRIATPADIAPWDIDVSPDGAGLPPGRGTARDGAALYAAQCESCHGTNGVRGDSPALAGGTGTIGKGDHMKPIKTVGSYWPYATSLFAYIRRAMPYYDSKSLDADQLYAVTAYILALNGLVRDDAVIDAASLPRVVMPNRDGFYRWQPGEP